MTAKYLFICGCPRSGTSPSALIGNISGVGIVQDLCLMFYLKKAALQIMLEANGVPEGQTPLCNMAPTFDLRSTEFFMQCNVCFKSYFEIEGRLHRSSFFIYGLFSVPLNSPDPRKDRGQELNICASDRVDVIRLLALEVLKNVCLLSFIPKSGADYLRQDP